MMIQMNAAQGVTVGISGAERSREAASLAGLFVAAVDGLCRLDALYRQRRALAAMDADRRADLGLSRQDIAAELRRPVWQG